MLKDWTNLTLCRLKISCSFVSGNLINNLKPVRWTNGYLQNQVWCYEQYIHQHKLNEISGTYSNMSISPEMGVSFWFFRLPEAVLLLCKGDKENSQRFNPDTNAMRVVLQVIFKDTRAMVQTLHLTSLCAAGSIIKGSELMPTGVFNVRDLCCPKRQTITRSLRSRPHGQGFYSNYADLFKDVWACRFSTQFMAVATGLPKAIFTRSVMDWLGKLVTWN